MPYQTLTNIRVIDATTGIAGPYCGKMLADYGAEVIKLELPAAPDHSRDVGAFLDGIPHPEKSALYLHLNAGKKGITLDPSTEDGKRIFTELASQSDVVLESFRPGQMAEWGIGYHDLRQNRSGLVMTSVTPYGQSGPHKDYQFTELTIFASGGGMHREGLPEREPLRYGAEIAQYFSGTTAAAASMIALFGVATHGEGEWIDISMQECMAGHPHQAGRRAPWIYGNEPDPRKPPRLAAAGMREPYAVGSFHCKDGYVSFLPLGSRMWPQLARMIDRPDLIDNPRYRSADDRTERREELEAIFQAWFNDHTRLQIFAAGQREGLPCAPIMESHEALENPHFRDRSYFVDLMHPDAGSLTYTGLPFRLSDTPIAPNTPAPRLGQHNDQIYADLLNITAPELAQLRSKGVV